MSDLIKGDTINMAELSQQNGQSELENFKAIMRILAVKAQYHGKQKVILSCKEDSNGIQTA